MKAGACGPAVIPLLWVSADVNVTSHEPLITQNL